MTSSPEQSIPVICQEETNDLQKIKEASNKALKNIQTLYDEIMTPKSYSDLEDECDIEFLSTSTPATMVEDTHQHTKRKKSKSSLDLCSRCEKYVSYCSSCCARKKDNQRLIVHNNLLEPNNRYINETIPKFNITVPQPFSLTADNIKRQEAKAIKIAKLKEELEKEVEKELNFRVRSQPVPRHVNLPLYEEMAKRSENRKKERREKCHEILEKETRPFNLSASAKIRSKSTCDIAAESRQFKAKPVPKNILSENVSKRIKDKEKLRKILMAHRAEELLKQSSLPFTPKQIPRSFSMSNLSPDKNVNVKLSKLNIDAVTKRLYTTKCKETIENWNNKVLERNTYRDKNAKVTNDCVKHKLFPDYSLPFYNFPVRMSTAAMLREKQIREGLSARKRKEEQDEITKEEMVRKRKDFLKNIWPRLKSVEPTMNSSKEIEEKVKGFKVSQKIRKQEYEKEIEEMMKRVSKQYLLIERQSKETKEILGETATKCNKEVSDEESSDGKEASERQASSDEASEKPLSNTLTSEKQASNQNDLEGSEEFESSSATSEKSDG